jgi:hypothetical protein
MRDPQDTGTADADASSTVSSNPPSNASDRASGRTSRYTYITDWPSPDPDEGAQVAAFWKREGALADDDQIALRLPQLVMHVRDGDAVAAVCTARLITPPQFGQPVYYYRTFVGQAWRTTSLVFRLARRAIAVLEHHAATHDFPAIGVLIELEADRFRQKGRAPIWPTLPFVYIGRSPSGLETRVYYFKGAGLKKL